MNPQWIKLSENESSCIPEPTANISAWEQRLKVAASAGSCPERFLGFHPAASNTCLLLISEFLSAAHLKPERDFPWYALIWSPSDHTAFREMSLYKALHYFYTIISINSPLLIIDKLLVNPENCLQTTDRWRKDHICPALVSLHRLPIKFRKEFKLLW